MLGRKFSALVDQAAASVFTIYIGSFYSRNGGQEAQAHIYIVIALAYLVARCVYSVLIFGNGDGDDAFRRGAVLGIIIGLVVTLTVWGVDFAFIGTGHEFGFYALFLGMEWLRRCIQQTKFYVLSFFPYFLVTLVLVVLDFFWVAADKIDFFEGVGSCVGVSFAFIFGIFALVSVGYSKALWADLCSKVSQVSIALSQWLTSQSIVIIVAFLYSPLMVAAFGALRSVMGPVGVIIQAMDGMRLEAARKQSLKAIMWAFWVVSFSYIFLVFSFNKEILNLFFDGAVAEVVGKYEILLLSVAYFSAIYSRPVFIRARSAGLPKISTWIIFSFISSVIVLVAFEGREDLIFIIAATALQEVVFMVGIVFIGRRGRI